MNLQVKDLQVKDAADEIKRLQRCINDLLSLLALPAFWSGNEPSQIIRIVLDALLGMLNLDFAYARVKATAEATPSEILRVAGSSKLTFLRPSEICVTLGNLFKDDQSCLPVRDRLGDEEVSMFPVPLGIHGEMGMIVAGSERPDFPGQTESLLLSVAANQATIGLHDARLLTAQRLISTELDRRVAERTTELAAKNEELKREIFERALAEEALAMARAELAKVAQVTSLGVLTASIAHEVNQPLSGIVTNASTCLRMLSADPPNIEGARETARRTIRDGNRAADVITRLRALYNKKELAPELMDLNEATREVTALTMPELQRASVILRHALAEDLPRVVGDRVQLQQVVLNLLRNGADAMSAVDGRARELLIRTERDGENQVRLSVRDSGTGVTPQAAERMFEAFYTTKTDGMGIGLSVSRSIIEAHQGRLWASANDGPGATFSFVIPCKSHGFAADETRVGRSDSSVDAA
jgi:signal transduction histidine kinase